MTDIEAYKLYPQSREWYNKLHVATRLGYLVGVHPVPAAGNYIVRPITNLHGCGIGARVQFLNNNTAIPDNHFWSEIFIGNHITIDYSRVNNEWLQGNTFQGFNSLDDLVHFTHWSRTAHMFILPKIFNNITSDHINIEIIGNKIIEVHLRLNTDPVQWDEFVPIWDQNQQCPNNYIRIADIEQHVDRLGFFVKNRSNTILEHLSGNLQSKVSK